MALKHLTPIDFSKLEAINFRFQNLSASPGTPALGQAYLDTDDNLIYYWNGSSWASLQAGSSLTQEQVEDFVGAMVAGNTETGIAVTYDDAGSKLNFAVDDEYISDLVGAMFAGNTETGITATYQDADNTIDLVVAIDSSMITDFAAAVDERARDAVGAALVAGNNIDITVDDAGNTITIDVEQLTSADLSDFNTAVDERARDALGTALVAGNNIDITVNDAGDTITIDVEALTAADLSDFDEAAQDAVGAMVTGNTETGIAVTYDDAGNKLNFAVGTLDTLPAPVADLSVNTHKITNLVAPTAATDAANKAYVDAAAAGIDWKASVRAATTAAGTLASSFENGDTIDGVVLATGDRILIKDQAAGAENGIYIVQAAGAPVRAADADANAELTAGTAVFVEEGTTNADSGWLLTNNGAVVVGTTALVFTQFTSLGQITAGAGLSKTGSSLDVNVDGSSIEINADTLRVKAAGITDAMLASTFTKKYAVAVGDGAATAIAVTHNLNSRDVQVQVYDAATYETVFCDVVRTSVNVVTVTFAVAPANNAYRVVVTG